MDKEEKHTFKQALSYSAMLKSQLAGAGKNAAKHCLIAEAYAIIKIGTKTAEKYGESFILLHTENVFLAMRCSELLRTVFGIRLELSVRTSSRSKKAHYLIYIAEKSAVQLLQELDGKTILKKSCCKQAYLRGAFLTCASISDPGKNYHLEFVLATRALSLDIIDALSDFEIDAGVVVRKKNHVVYLKDGEKIAQVLGIIGAGKSLLDFENLRIFKTVSNEINRQVNCETANIAKTAKAFVSFQEDIEYIESVRGITHLPAQLIEIARIKLENPSATLKELSEMLNPPISKSGVNHRLRKISEIAEKLRSGLYD